MKHRESRLSLLLAIASVSLVPNAKLKACNAFREHDRSGRCPFAAQNHMHLGVAMRPEGGLHRFLRVDSTQHLASSRVTANAEKGFGGDGIPGAENARDMDVS